MYNNQTHNNAVIPKKEINKVAGNAYYIYFNDTNYGLSIEDMHLNKDGIHTPHIPDAGEQHIQED